METLFLHQGQYQVGASYRFFIKPVTDFFFIPKYIQAKKPRLFVCRCQVASQDFVVVSMGYQERARTLKHALALT